MNKKYITILFGIFLVPLFIIKPIHAYDTYAKWGSNKVTMRAAKNSFPSGNPYRTALGTVVNRFNNNPSNQYFVQQYDDTSVGFNNDQNEVWFSSDSKYDPAYTFWWTSWWSGKIVETDIVFWNKEDYTTSMNKTTLWSYGGSKRPFQTTAMHEYGHAAGLLHVDSEYNIMGRDWTHIHCNGSTARSYVGEDACDGLVKLYGRASGGSYEDLSVSIFEYSGKGGEYSIHNLCDVTTTSGSIPFSALYNGQRRYQVKSGSTYNFEFTYENNGETTQTARVGYYLSTNNYISKYDRLLKTRSIAQSRGNVWTHFTSIKIPTDVIANRTYYLGVIIDDNNKVSEVDSSNNAAYHIIKITP